jgi:hypothetical protein
LLKCGRYHLQAHGLCGNPFPRLADLFWLNVVGNKQLGAGRIETHAHARRNQRGQAFELFLIHFRQNQQPVQPLLARHKSERGRYLTAPHALQPLEARTDC